MPQAPWLPNWLDSRLTVQRPVSYWSFWAALRWLVPLLAASYVVAWVVAGPEFALRSFAPLPFVFVAATLSYAVRSFDRFGALLSVVIACVYAFLLWLDGIGVVLLTQPGPMLSVVAVLAFVAALAGFGSPTLHGQRGREFERAREEWRED